MACSEHCRRCATVKAVRDKAVVDNGLKGRKVLDPY